MKSLKAFNFNVFNAIKCLIALTFNVLQVLRYKIKVIFTNGKKNFFTCPFK
jgi:hypothetical protein